MWLASSTATVRTIRRSSIEQVDEAFMKDRTRLRLQHMRRGDTGEKLAAAGVDQREFFGESCMACDQITKGSHGGVLMMSGLPSNFLRPDLARSFSWRHGLPACSNSIH